MFFFSFPSGMQDAPLPELSTGLCKIRRKLKLWLFATALFRIAQGIAVRESARTAPGYQTESSLPL